MNIAICDDDKKLLKDFRHLIEIHMDLTGINYHITEFTSGEELLEYKNKKDIHLLFLDIKMGSVDGMETARQLKKSGKKMLIIFVTAYPDFVFQGYEVQAFHYILKPYRETKIKEVLDRAISELDIRKEHSLVIQQRSGILCINTQKVTYFKSDKRNIFAVSTEGTDIFYGKLNDVETKMPPCYQRIHNRYLINLNYVSEIGSNYCICHDEKLPVSRTYRHELAMAFAKMMLQ